jgi:hypothetical protein
MTLLEIANYVCNLVGKTDSTSVTRCKEYVRQHHQLIYDSALWRESLEVDRVTFTSRSLTAAVVTQQPLLLALQVQQVAVQQPQPSYSMIQWVR